MQLKVEVEVQAPKQAVWAVITDIEGSASRISSIQKLEILEKPAGSLVGLKWRETRVMFGQEATEVMWVTAAVDNDHYDVRAESHGAIYTTTMAVKGEGASSTLSMAFGAEVLTFGAKVMWALTGWIAVRAMRKALLKDLSELRDAAEAAHRSAAAA